MVKAKTRIEKEQRLPNAWQIQAASTGTSSCFQSTVAVYNLTRRFDLLSFLLPQLIRKPFIDLLTLIVCRCQQPSLVTTSSKCV